MADDQKTLVPIPDPTLLTTAQLYREISALNDSVNIRLQGLRSELLGVEEKTKGILENINARFVERDVRFAQKEDLQSRASEAATAAHNTAINKFEASITKQLEDIGKRIEILTSSLDQRISNINSAMDERISDLKDRMTRAETRTLTATAVTKDINQETATGQQSAYYTVAIIVGIVGALFGLGMLILTIIQLKH